MPRIVRRTRWLGGVGLDVPAVQALALEVQHDLQRFPFELRRRLGLFPSPPDQVRGRL